MVAQLILIQLASVRVRAGQQNLKILQFLTIKIGNDIPDDPANPY